MYKRDKRRQNCTLAALLLNIVTLMMFILPRTNLSATTVSGWGFNLLALVQLVMIGILLVRLVKHLRSRSWDRF